MKSNHFCLPASLPAYCKTHSSGRINPAFFLQWRIRRRYYRSVLFIRSYSLCSTCTYIWEQVTIKAAWRIFSTNTSLDCQYRYPVMVKSAMLLCAWSWLLSSLVTNTYRKRGKIRWAKLLWFSGFLRVLWKFSRELLGIG